MKSKNNYSYIAVVVLVIAAFIGGIYALHGSGKITAETSGVITDPKELLNKPVPQFTLEDRNGVKYSPADLKGKNVVLFFNEGLMCYPACWNQIVALGKDKRFKRNDTIALSVVVDEPSDWQSAIMQMPELGYATIIFDHDRAVSKRFGMLTADSSMHYGSFPGHTYVVIDKEGVVRFVYDDPRMAINDDLIASEMDTLK